MDGKAIARETLSIIEAGKYIAGGRTVDIADAIAHAVEETRVYRPGDVAPAPNRDARDTRIEVTGETTAAAGRRLVLVEKLPRVCALNFASARKPGGGFLGGAKAQEEDLARASALYACLEPARAYYDANRREDSTLYTDHVIYSPDVPFFRDDKNALLPDPALLSIITAPAPNAGAIRSEERPKLRPTLERRAAIVLEVAARHNHHTLVLGAWGCGVFANDPTEVASVFRAHLTTTFARTFSRVVFAVWDTSPAHATLAAFRSAFPA